MNQNRRLMPGVGAVIFLFLVGSGCNLKPSGRVLARVNGEIITQQEFQAKIDALPPYYRALAKEQKEKFLDELINEKLFLKVAQKRGVDRNPEVKELLEQARKKIIVTKFIEDQINKLAKVGDNDIEDYYNMHKKEFVTPTRYRASHILVSTEQEAKTVLGRLDKGEEFAAVAKEASIDPSKANGGDLGYFTEGQMIPDFESACFKLEAGQTSGPIKTQFGYHIIKLTDKKPSETKTLNEVSEQIRRRIMDVKKMEKLQDLIKQLRARAKININQELLKADKKEDDKI